MSDQPRTRTPTVAGQRAAGRLRKQLVAELRRTGHLRSEKVASALGDVPRELFVSDIAASQGLEAVYRNEALAVKTDNQGRWLSSSSQPSMMALMLEQLELMPGQRVLEIGAGTGYNAALLRYLVGPAGRVTTVEIDPELARRARSALGRSGYAASVVLGDGREGFPAAAPYDRIIVTAKATEIPNAWIDQLHPDGRLELPLELHTDAAPQVIPVLERRDGTLQSVAMTWGGFMALHGGDGGQHEPPHLYASQRANGTHTSLMRITGPALKGLSAAGRRRLLALAVEGPRSRQPRGHLVTRWPAPPNLLLYLLQRVPDARRVKLHTPGREGIGIVSADGRCVAVASLRVRHLGKECRPDQLQQPKRDRWWTETYGGSDVTSELHDILESGRRSQDLDARSCTSRPGAR